MTSMTYFLSITCVYLLLTRILYKHSKSICIVHRLIGLCLLQNELCPLFLNRHVIKYILGRPIRFHDLAFFDSVIYESLRQLVIDAETKDSNSLFSALDLTFRYNSSLALFFLSL